MENSVEPHRIRIRAQLSALVALLVFFVVPLRAQTAPASDATISTDRPSVTNSSVIVPLRALQVENGLLVTNSMDSYLLDFPETSLRYGLLTKTEIRFLVPDYFHNLSSGAAPPSGFGDLALGFKQQIGPLHGFDMSAIFFVSLPTGANRISSHGYDPGLQLPWSRKLSSNWTAAGQVAFYWPTQGQKHNFTRETTFLMDRQLGKRWDAFAEYAGDFPERGGSPQYLHSGASYKITARQQLDFHVAVGVSHAASRAYIGVGYSFLITPRR